MDSAQSGNDRVILHRDVAAQRGVVRHDDVTPELAVVRDMRVTQKQIVGANPGWDFRRRAAVNRAVFPKHVVIAHFEKSRLADVFEVLGLAPDDRKREKLVVVADLGGSFNNHMRMEHAVVSNFDMGTNQAVRTNPDVGPEFGERRDNGGWVDHAPIRP
jgi:hypothetical protein